MALVISICTPRDNEIIVVNKSDHNISSCYASIAEEYIRDVISGDFTITDIDGQEIPYTITDTKLVIFPVTIEAGSKLYYTLRQGVPTVMLKIDKDIDFANTEMGSSIAVAVI